MYKKVRSAFLPFPISVLGNCLSLRRAVCKSVRIRMIISGMFNSVNL